MQGAFYKISEHTGHISFGALMNFPVTLAAESDQIVLGIRTLMVPCAGQNRQGVQSRVMVLSSRFSLLPEITTGPGVLNASGCAGRVHEGGYYVNWQEVAKSHLPSWNSQLLLTDGSFLQYPYWNEAYRVFHCSPVYLVYGDIQSPLAYVCILTIGAGLRIGIVQRGPVELVRGALTDEAVSSLYEWAQSHQYAFVRFNPSNADLLACLARIAPTQCSDSFPVFPGYTAAAFELVIDQKDDDRAMLAGFQSDARRQIRRGLEAGYVVRSSDGPEQFTEAWRLFIADSKRKGFTLNRPVESYLEMVRLARPHECARTYTVYSNGHAIGAAFVVRDRNTAVMLRTAAELTKPSCSALMHWVAMRDMFRAGACHYSFGPADPPVNRYYHRFRPRRVLCPPPVTMEIMPRFCHIWHAVLPGLVAIKPALRWLARSAVGRWPSRLRGMKEPAEFRKSPSV